MPRGPEPPYLAVAAALRDRLNGGEWLPGEALPSVSALADEYGVSRATAARGVKVLTDEGRVYTVAGWGTFAAEHPPVS
ncbi:MAG TPA: GntR family transcriptional regulator [Streptosporangiaceae bacterium]|nr:GntR family transcriptional regulator [Streptosporangiaceae bacterium]